MELRNHTRHATGFFNTGVSEDRMLGAVSVKAAFRILDGTLVLDDEHPWPVDGPPVKTEFGELDGETPFLRDGVDFILLGRAYPSSPAATSARVSIRAPGLSCDIAVTGDRRWLRRGPGNLVVSDPLPFESIPLTWERAYGGKAKVESGEMPFADNPAGLGFYLDAAQAEGQPLPNLEHPEHPVRSWEDRPEPLCPAPCPKDYGLRARRSAEFDFSRPMPRIKRILPAHYNNAHPKLIFPQEPVSSGTIQISGVRPGGGGLRFTLPDLAFHASVQLEERLYTFPAHLESILVLAEEERVIFGFKCVFRYRIVPLERRVATLWSGKNPSAPPEDYRVEWPEPATRRITTAHA